MDLIKSISAGICVSIGCKIYLSCENKYIGALLFSIGLIAILILDFNLFTGKVCYLSSYKDILNLKTTLIGNAIGCILFGFLFPMETAKTLCILKLRDNLFNIFIKAFYCNVLIYIAVESYKRKNTLLPTIFCIPVFILSGYEHSIADITYFVMAKSFSFESFLFILIVIFGNFTSGILISYLQNQKFYDKI